MVANRKIKIKSTDGLTQLKRVVAKFGTTETKHWLDEHSVPKSVAEFFTSTDFNSDYILVFDAELNCIDVNKASLNLFPTMTTKGDVTGKHLLELSSDLMETDRYEKCLKVLQTGVPIVESIEIPGPRFSEVHIDAGVLQVNSGIGIIAKFAPQSIDWEEIERQIREADEEYRKFVGDTHEIVYVLDQKGVITYISQGVESIIGYESSEIIGTNVFDHIYSEDVPFVIQSFQKGSLTNIPRPIEFRILTKSGSVCWVHNFPRILFSQNRFVGYQGVLHEITEFKQAEAERKKSEEQYRVLVETMSDGLSAIDNEGVITFTNERLCMMTGYSKDELVGYPVINLMTIASKNRFKKEFVKRQVGENAPYELALQTKDGSQIIVNIAPQVLRNSAGNMIGSFAVITDVTRRKDIEERLRKSEKYLKLAHQIAQLSHWELDISNNIVSFSGGIKKTLGLKEDRINISSILNMIHQDDVSKLQEALLQPIKGQEEIEFRIRSNEGNIRWLAAKSGPIVKEYGSKDKIFGYVIDITDRKHAEARLEQSEQKLWHAQAMANLGYWEWNDLTNEVLLSEEMQRIIEYDKEKAVFSGRPQIIHPDDLVKLQEAITETQKGGNPQIEFRLVFPTGNIKWIQAGITYVDSDKDRFGGGKIFGYAIDITERKQMEDALKDSEETLKRAQRLARIGSWIWNLKDDSFLLSEELMHIYGTDKREFRSFEDVINTFIHPDDRKGITEAAEEVINRGSGGPLFYRIIKADGAIRWMNATIPEVRQYDADGSPEIMVGAVQDITERKQAEEELEQSEEKYRLHFESVNDVVFSYDQNYRITSISPSVEKYLGYKAEELKGKLFTELNILMPESLERATKDTLRVFADEQIFPSEYEFIAKDGTIHLGEVSSAPLFSVAGKLIEVVSVARDITERKRGEEALRESQEKLRTVFDSIGDGVTVLDLAGNIIDVNETVLRIKGYNREDVIGRFGLDFVPEKDRARAIEGMMGLLSGEVERTPFEEYMLLGKDGSEIPCEASASVLRDGAGDVVGLISVERDLRERKETEYRLRESEEQLRSFMESATDVFNIWDSNLNLVYTPEKGVKDYFPPGTKKEDILGKSLSEIVPDIKKTDRYDEYLKVIETGKPFVAEDVIPNSIFGDRHISIKAFKAGDGMGQVITDITKSKQSEKQLQEYAERLRAMAKQLTEVEESLRHRTARELHDNVGQNLTALGINLNMIRAKLEKAGMKEEQNILNDSQLVIEQTTESIRDVMASLRPPVLEDYGLLATLKWHGDRFASRTGIAITVQGEEPDPRMNAETEITLFRIYQEALTNISKHAKASNVTVYFNRKDGRRRLLISDNGIGFNTGEISKYADQANWGLVTMAERADSIGASFKIDSTPGRGTRVIIEI